MRFITEIREAAESGRLTEPFRAADVRAACPRWAPKTYGTFLSKHCEGNPGDYGVYFVRVARGVYRLA